MAPPKTTPLTTTILKPPPLQSPTLLKRISQLSPTEASPLFFIVTATAVAMLSELMLFSSIVGVSAYGTSREDVQRERAECVSCLYNTSAPPPPPQLLWATSNSAFLRLRSPCLWSCRRTVQWNYNLTFDSSSSSGNNEKLCFGLEYCNINRTSITEEGPTVIVKNATSMRVRTMLWSEKKSELVNSSPTDVHFCQGKLPPKPENLTCELRDARRSALKPLPLLRWSYRPDICRCYVHFVVHTQMRNSWLPWRWMGEASPDGRTFSGDVERCIDDPNFLCAKLSNADENSTIQIGVRRAYEDIHSIAMSNEVRCSAPKVSPPSDTSTRRTDMSIPVISPSSISTELIISPTSSDSFLTTESTDGGNYWRVVALVMSCAFVVAVAMVPLAFCAGRRWNAAGDSRGAVPWKPLSDERAALPAPQNNDYQLPEYREVPPAYTYDYAYCRPPRSLPPPPLPTAPPPTLPLAPPSVDVSNDFYSPAESSEGKAPTPSI